jgi:hypothetical protein
MLPVFIIRYSIVAAISKSNMHKHVLYIQVLDMILLPVSSKPASSNTEVADIDMSRCFHQERTNMIKQKYCVKVANVVTL